MLARKTVDTVLAKRRRWLRISQVNIVVTLNDKACFLGVRATLGFYISGTVVAVPQQVRRAGVSQHGQQEARHRSAHCVIGKSGVRREIFPGDSGNKSRRMRIKYQVAKCERTFP